LRENAETFAEVKNILSENDFLRQKIEEILSEQKGKKKLKDFIGVIGEYLP
jgi:hypothetical protein